MMDKILTNAGFVLNKTYKETRFLSPPKDTSYAVYSKTIESRGSDFKNEIKDIDISIELYEYSPDPEAEARIEAQLNSYGIEYTKQPRYWISAEQLYQVIYDFSYVTKGG